MNIKYLYLLLIITSLSSFKVLYKTPKFENTHNLNYNFEINMDTLFPNKANNLKGQKWHCGGGIPGSSCLNSYYFLNNNKFIEESVYSGGQYIVRKYIGTYHYCPIEKIVYLRKKDISEKYDGMFEKLKKGSIDYSKLKKEGFFKKIKKYFTKNNKWTKEQLILRITSKDTTWHVKKGWVKSDNNSHIKIEYSLDPEIIKVFGKSYKIEKM